MSDNQTKNTDGVGKSLLQFLHIEVAGGVVLLVCTAIALFLANSAWSQGYLNFWQMPISINIGNFSLSHSIQHWINDGLMTLFFFVVGLEMKREFVAGELKNKKAAMLPIAAAVGGMLVPACIYLLVLGKNEGTAGWGIPMATDIAFVVGFLSLFGKRVPKGLKIFILSLAIVDDLGAILVIAAVYSANISFIALAIGFLSLGGIIFLNRIGVRNVFVYILVGAVIWFAFLFSGVHPTISGVLLGLLTPAYAWIGDRAFFDELSSLTEDWQTPANKGLRVKRLIGAARETVSPLERLELALHPWVALFIMPVFALANAGVPLVKEAIISPVSVAVSLGLLLGKPLGIVLFSLFSVYYLGAKLPHKVTWNSMIGAGFLSGIGFTMSIFIANLALSGDLLVSGKVGAMMGSFISASLGLGILYYTLPPSRITASN